MNQALSVVNILITQDPEGRFCLNDLHKASGGNPPTSPRFWTRTQSFQLLEAELKLENPEFQPVSIIKGGTTQGTFVCKELVYAYAMWISPAFLLKVIRAYDSLVTKPEQKGLPGQTLLEVSAAITEVRQSVEVLTRVLNKTAGYQETLREVRLDLLNNRKPRVQLTQPRMDNAFTIEQFCDENFVTKTHLYRTLRNFGWVDGKNVPVEAALNDGFLISQPKMYESEGGRPRRSRVWIWITQKGYDVLRRVRGIRIVKQ